MTASPPSYVPNISPEVELLQHLSLSQFSINKPFYIPKDTQYTIHTNNRFKMSMSQAANLLEKVMGHKDTATIEQDVSNPANERAKYADPSGETMKALCWMAKGDVQVCMYLEGHHHIPGLGTLTTEWVGDTPKPAVIEDRDVILKVTGSTVCGSDLHLLHGSCYSSCHEALVPMTWNCRRGRTVAKG